MATPRHARFGNGSTRRLAGIALAAGALALQTRAEIGVQNSGGGLYGEFNKTSYTQSVTVSDGDDRILVVSIHTRNWYNPSSVTYGGTALTYATGSRAEAGVSYNGVRTQFFYLLSPPVGTANLTASFDTAPWKIGMRRMVLIGAKQQAPQAVGTGSVNGTSAGATTTTLSEGALLVSAVTHYNNTTVTPVLPLASKGANANPITIGTATLLTDHPGSYTTQWTAGSSGTFCQSLLAFAAAPPVATLITLR
jgi:hypothetical protein